MQGVCVENLTDEINRLEEGVVEIRENERILSETMNLLASNVDMMQLQVGS